MIYSAQTQFGINTVAPRNTIFHIDQHKESTQLMFEDCAVLCIEKALRLILIKQFKNLHRSKSNQRGNLTFLRKHGKHKI